MRKRQRKKILHRELAKLGQPTITAYLNKPLAVERWWERLLYLAVQFGPRVSNITGRSSLYVTLPNSTAHKFFPDMVPWSSGGTLVMCRSTQESAARLSKACRPRGEVQVFDEVDCDDCEPDSEWMKQRAKYERLSDWVDSRRIITDFSTEAQSSLVSDETRRAVQKTEDAYEKTRRKVTPL